MRKCLLTVLIFVLVEKVFSQSKKDSLQQNDKSYMAISSGVAFPLGNYGLKDLGIVGSGFAKAGTNLEVSVAKIIKGKTGIIFMYRNQSNNVDQTQLSNQYSLKYPGITWDVVSNPWKINAFMVGSYSSFPLGQKKLVSLDLKFLAGMVRATSPQVIATGLQGGVSSSAEQLAATTNTFAYCLGIGIKVELSNNFFLLVHTDYMSVGVLFKNIPVISPSSQATTANPFVQGMSTLNCNIGLAYRIE